MAKQVILEHRGIRLDLLNRTVQVNGQPVDLISREFALLELPAGMKLAMRRRNAPRTPRLAAQS